MGLPDEALALRLVLLELRLVRHEADDGAEAEQGHQVDRQPGDQQPKVLLRVVQQDSKQCVTTSQYQIFSTETRSCAHAKYCGANPVGPPCRGRRRA